LSWYDMIGTLPVFWFHSSGWMQPFCRNPHQDGHVAQKLQLPGGVTQYTVFFSTFLSAMHHRQKPYLLASTRLINSPCFLVLERFLKCKC
jgi:hypothetical protein